MIIIFGILLFSTKYFFYYIYNLYDLIIISFTSLHLLNIRFNNKNNQARAFSQYFTLIIAERTGFEPAIHFWCIHAFQACLFSHSSTSPICPFKCQRHQLLLKRPQITKKNRNPKYFTQQKYLFFSGCPILNLRINTLV